MQGLHRSPLTVGDLNLRQSVNWTSPSNPTIRKGALQERLEELLVLELHKDGGRAFLNFTVRGLYKHVLKAITRKISGKRERDEVNMTFKKKSSRNNLTKGDVISPVVLGALASHHEADEEDEEDSDDPAIANKERHEDEEESPNVNLELPTHSANSPYVPLSGPLSRRVSASNKADNATYRERLGGYLYVFYASWS